MELVLPSTEAEDDEKEVRTNLTLQICDFSNEVTARCSTSKHLKERFFHFLSFSCSLFSPVYPDTFRNREYVQFDMSAFSFPKVDFCLKHLDCFISVIDNAGNKRFTRSLSGYREEKYQQEERYSKIALREDEYISRQTLLNDPTELLPNGILTIDVDIFLVFGLQEKNQHRLVPVELSDDERLIDKKLKLITDLKLSKTLREVSTVFRDMFAYTAEENSELLEIPHDDGVVLFKILMIVKGNKYKVKRIKEIFDLLKVSDKYDILNMPEVCRQIIKNFLCSSNLARLKTSMRYSYLCVFHEMLIQNAEDCRDSTDLELVEEFVRSFDLSLVEEGHKTTCNWEQEEKNIFLELELSYEQSLGFKFTYVSSDPKKDHDYSYCN